MRGRTTRQVTFLTVTPDELISAEHPIRRVKQFVEAALAELSPVFDEMYAEGGRPSIPPEHLLKAQAVLNLARQQHLLSSQHFTVDGTLLESWASLKSFKPRGANLGGQRKPKRARRRPPPGGGSNPEVDFHGEKRSNLTHLSSTDPEAMLAKKARGREARLSFAGHLLMENRNGLAVDVDDLRDLKVTPHVAQNITEQRGSRIDGRTATQPGYVISQRIRKRIEEIFGWLKTVAGGRKLRYRGVKRNQLWADVATAAFNLVRMGNLLAEAV
jgi:hypothetical protein